MGRANRSIQEFGCRNLGVLGTRKLNKLLGRDASYRPIQSDIYPTPGTAELTL
jgi:hypothetical protein